MSKRVDGWIGVLRDVTQKAQDDGQVIFEEYSSGIGLLLEPKLDLVVDFALRGADKSKYELSGFKFYDPHSQYVDQLICRDYQYYEGRVHTLPDLSKLHMCRTGFHFCNTIEGCSYYYPFRAAPVTPVLGRIVLSENTLDRYTKYCAGELYVGRRLSDIFKCLWSIKEIAHGLQTNYDTDNILALNARRYILADTLRLRPKYHDECLKIIAALDEKAILVLCIEEYWREYDYLVYERLGANIPATFDETVKLTTAICEEVYNKHCKEEFEAFIKEENENEK